MKVPSVSNSEPSGFVAASSSLAAESLGWPNTRRLHSRLRASKGSSCSRKAMDSGPEAERQKHRRSWIINSDPNLHVRYSLNSLKGVT